MCCMVSFLWLFSQQLIQSFSHLKCSDVHLKILLLHAHIYTFLWCEMSTTSRKYNFFPLGRVSMIHSHCTGGNSPVGESGCRMGWAANLSEFARNMSLSWTKTWLRAGNSPVISLSICSSRSFCLHFSTSSLLQNRITSCTLSGINLCIDQIYIIIHKKSYQQNNPFNRQNSDLFHLCFMSYSKSLYLWWDKITHSLDKPTSSSRLRPDLMMLNKISRRSGIYIFFMVTEINLVDSLCKGSFL